MAQKRLIVHNIVFKGMQGKNVAIHVAEKKISGCVYDGVDTKSTFLDSLSHYLRKNIFQLCISNAARDGAN